MEMAGAVLGVLIQKVLPNWLYLLVAGLVLSATAHKTYKKYFQTAKKEKAAREKAKQEKEGYEGGDKKEEAAVDSKGTEDKSADVEGETAEGKEETVTKSKDELELRRQYLKDDMRQYPLEKLGSLVLLWIGLFVLTLLKGGKGVESLIGIDCKSPWYLVLIGCQFLWMFGYAIVYGFILSKKQKEREAVKYPFQPEDPIWNDQSLRFYGAFTFIAGIVAGLIGIGGGMVLGPLMLIMGIHPRVSTATTGTMIVLTSSSVAVIFVTSGLVPWSYAVFYFGICLIGAIIGKSQIDGYVKRTGRASVLVFVLATIILVATIGCFVILVTRLADNNWCFEGFRPFCSVSSEESCAGDRMLEQAFSFEEISHY